MSFTMSNDPLLSGSYALPTAAEPLFLMSAGVDDRAAEDDSDDLDDLLDDTGAVVNRGNGKSGTATEAEPDPKPKQS
jgi:hypothetical protein